MKKIFVFVLGLVSILGLVSCAEKASSPLSVIDDTSMIQLSYTVGEEERGITFSDNQNVVHICDNLKSLTLEPLKDSPENEAIYKLDFYGETTKEELLRIDIMDNHTLVLEGTSYQITEGELDIAYLEEAIEIVDHVLSTTQ